MNYNQIEGPRGKINNVSGAKDGPNKLITPQTKPDTPQPNNLGSGSNTTRAMNNLNQDKIIHRLDRRKQIDTPAPFFGPMYGK